MTNTEYQKKTPNTTSFPLNSHNSADSRVTQLVTLNPFYRDNGERHAKPPRPAAAAAAARDSASLGNIATSASKLVGSTIDPARARRDDRRARYEAQRVGVGALQLAYGRDPVLKRWINRLNACCRYPIPFEQVTVKAAAADKHYYGGLCRCASPYCPHCAPRIAFEKAREIAQTVGYAVQNGMVVLHVTYTFRHSNIMNAREADSRLRAALRAMHSGRSWQDFKKAFGYVGATKAIETTYGKNGFHPHAHVLMTFDPAAAQDKSDNLKLRAERARASAAAAAKNSDHGRAARARARAESLEERAYFYAAAAVELSNAVRMQAGLNHEMRALDAELTALQAADQGDTTRALELIGRLRAARRSGAPAAGMQAVLDDLWAGALDSCDMSGLEGRRLTASFAPASIADYLTKTGRAAGIALELSSSTATKRGRHGSKTMNDLLTAAANGDFRAGQLWASWRFAVRCKSVFSTTKGFRALSAAAAAAAAPAAALEEHKVVLTLKPEIWRAVVWHNGRAKLLELTETDLDAARAYLAALPKDTPF